MAKRRKPTLGRPDEATAEESQGGLAVADEPHRIETSVRRQLLAEPGLRFASLVVRRIPNGVCLEGVLESESELPDISSLAQRVAGVEQVLNHLVHKQVANG